MDGPVAVFSIALAGRAHVCAQEVHYSPEERLGAADRQLNSTTKQSVDFASYGLAGRTVIDALNAADQRGVAIRIVLDPRERHDFVDLGDLSDNIWSPRTVGSDSSAAPPICVGDGVDSEGGLKKSWQRPGESVVARSWLDWHP